MFIVCSTGGNCSKKRKVKSQYIKHKTKKSNKVQMLFVNDRQQKNENNLLSVNKTAVWHSCTTCVNVTWIVTNAHILKRNAIFVCVCFFVLFSNCKRDQQIFHLDYFLMAVADNLVQCAALYFLQIRNWLRFTSSYVK